MQPILLYGLVALGYAGLTLATWRHLQLAPQAMALNPAQRLRVMRAILFVCLILQAYLLHEQIFTEQGFRFGFSTALAATFWLGSVFYWLESSRFPVQSMGLLLHPLSVLTAGLPCFFAAPLNQHMLGALSIWLKGHIVIALGAYGLFTIAAMHAVFMLLLMHTLHHVQQPRSSAGSFLQRVALSMPPLMALERILFRLLLAGLILLSLTLGSGMFFAEQLFGRPLKFDHKTLFSVLAWLNFAGLLLGHYGFGWRGRRALYYTLAGFGLLLLAYVGSRFVLEVLLQRF
ncbi:cytochrome C assembly family protein [Parvibium lacunae]|nr:cytochrome c biogenesis protein CcsA [Parvibium lacunae]